MALWEVSCPDCCVIVGRSASEAIGFRVGRRHADGTGHDVTFLYNGVPVFTLGQWETGPGGEEVNVKAEVSGSCISVTDGTTAKGKAYRLVTFLQTDGKHTELVRARVWNGAEAHPGKPFKAIATFSAFALKSGGAALGVDVFPS
jgi:hypothetical protein